MAVKLEKSWHVILAPAVLLSVIFACYGHTLNNFFVADDLWQVHYAWKTVSGNWQLIWENFSGNYIGIPGFQLYRPVLGLTFVADFLLWGINPLGYHLTSMLLYAGNVLLLYYFCLELSRQWALKRSLGFSFCSAVLFATTPLHCEAVTWLSGRADILSGFFYLLSLYLVALSRRKSQKVCLGTALLSFLLAIGSKEIAVCLPLVVFAFYFALPVAERQWIRTIARERELEEDLDRDDEDEKEPSRPSVDVDSSMESASTNGEKRAPSNSEASKPANSEASASLSSEAASGEARAPANSEASVRAKPGANPSSDVDAMSSHDGQKNTLQHFKRACLVALPFLGLSLLYLFVRLQVFGTVFGGYGGAFGLAKSQYVLQKWFDLALWSRVFIPFNVQVVQPLKEPLIIASVAILAAVSLFLIRIFTGSINRSFLLFMTIWILSTLIPLYGIWDVDPLLHNSRLAFFFTMPLSVFFPGMIFQPDREQTSVLRYLILSGMIVVGSIAFVALSGAYGFATYQTNQMWWRAGSAVQSILSEAKRLTSGLSGKEQIVLLGVPDDYNGAFVILNGSTMHHLLTPPFVAENLYDKVIVFKPFVVGPGEYIDASRLSRVLNEPGRVRGVYVWNPRTDGFRQISLERNDSEAQLDMPISREVKKGNWCVVPPSPVEVVGDVLKSSPAAEGTTFGITGLALNPREWDFLEFDCEIEKSNWQFSQLTPLMVRWNKQATNIALGAVRSQGPLSKQPVRVGLSQYWKWYQDEKIHTLEIVCGQADSIGISNVRLVRSSKLVPSIKIKGKEPRPSGEHVVLNKDQAMIEFDVTNIGGAHAVVLEITRPNVFFDASLRADRAKRQFPPRTVESLKGELPLDEKLLEKDSFTQVRVRAIDANGRPVGEVSDPITLYFAGEKVGPYLE